MEHALRRAGRKRYIPQIERVIKWPCPQGASQLDSLTEKELIKRAKKGDEEAFQHLVMRYRSLLESKLKKYFLAGADIEDLLQEALIGFFKAVRDFKRDRAQSFRCFAELCIMRQITSAVRTATRQKHQLLNNYLSIAQPPDWEEGEWWFEDALAKGFVADPDEQIFLKQVYSELKERMESELSELEREVLIAHLEGKSYQEIAAELKRDVKCVDNALQRARKKLGRWVEAISS